MPRISGRRVADWAFNALAFLMIFLNAALITGIDNTTPIKMMKLFGFINCVAIVILFGIKLVIYKGEKEVQKETLPK